MKVSVFRFQDRERFQVSVFSVQEGRLIRIWRGDP